MVSADEVMAWLAEVSDPEIPVISIIDLGIVRSVGWEGETCVVTITPTYSGCPAMTMIAEAVRAKLEAHGVPAVRVATQLSPAWSTDAISQAGRAALAAYGIAPPAERAIDISALHGIGRGRAASPAVACPMCGSAHTRLTSQFGSTPCKALYQCLDCREPFDYFKCH